MDLRRGEWHAILAKTVRTLMRAFCRAPSSRLLLASPRRWRRPSRRCFLCRQAWSPLAQSYPTFRNSPWPGNAYGTGIDYEPYASRLCGTWNQPIRTGRKHVGNGVLPNHRLSPMRTHSHRSFGTKEPRRGGEGASLAQTVRLHRACRSSVCGAITVAVSTPNPPFARSSIRRERRRMVDAGVSHPRTAQSDRAMLDHRKEYNINVFGPC